MKIGPVRAGPAAAECRRWIRHELLCADVVIYVKPLQCVGLLVRRIMHVVVSKSTNDTPPAADSPLKHA